MYFVINDGLKEEITDGIKTICEKYGISVIELSGIDKHNGHPEILGMKQIKEQIYDKL